MGFLRKLLFPLAILYGFVTALRNMLYDRGWLQSVSFDVPVIAVGNLSVGGTGKSPMVEYLIRLLQPHYRVAVLSRGYKRQTHGFRLASKNDSAETLGDEPFQFYKKFPAIRVAVDADRVRGIKSLLNLPDAPQVILLDDAFQHRRVKAGYYIVLTAYGDLYADDFMLPTGNLREGWRGAKRANCIVVTKCPSNLSDTEQDQIRKKLQIKKGQFLCFTSIGYADAVQGAGVRPVDEIRRESKLVLAGIAKPKPFFDYLVQEDDTVLSFADHHRFTQNELHAIASQANDRPIVTTEKDFARLKGKIDAQLFYLPIETRFLAGRERFDQAISDFVRQKTT